MSRFIPISAYPAHAVFQWRVVNNEEAKKFLGDAYWAVLKYSGTPAWLCFDVGDRSISIPPNDYIIRTESGRFVPVDREIYERLTR